MYRLSLHRGLTLTRCNFGARAIKPTTYALRQRDSSRFAHEMRENFAHEIREIDIKKIRIMSDFLA